MQNFKAIVEQKLIDFKAVEAYRKNYLHRKKRVITVISVVIILLSVLLSFIAYYLKSWTFFAVTVPSLLIFLLVLNYYLNMSYVRTIKEVIIGRLAKSIDKSISYYPRSSISKSVFSASGFVPKFNRFKGEDLFVCRFENLKMDFSQIKVSLKIERIPIPLFSGVFFVMNSPLKFTDPVYILPDYSERTAGEIARIAQELNILRDKLVVFENTYFEKYFVVFSKNPIYAKKIINKKLTDTLLELRKKFGSDIFLSVKNKKIYLGIDIRKNIFEIDIEKPVDVNYIKVYYDELSGYLNAAQKIYNVLID